MKNNIILVVATAALTSIGTLFAMKHFEKNESPFGAKNQQTLPVQYASFDPINQVIKAPPIDFRIAAESSVKAVVHIKTTINSRTVLARDPFAELFGGNQLRQYRTPEQMGSGSGVVVSSDGYIVTNNHVVSGADVVTVTFDDKHTAQAKVIGTDPSTDLAVLKISENNLPYMEFGNSDDVHLGEWVLAVGYPLSLDATVTAGIVSAKGRSIGINSRQSRTAIESFIQTDAAVNPGNSGGPLVNTIGQLIGINSAIASPTGSYAGYSYAIPANLVKKAAADIIQYGAVQRGFLGIETRDIKSANPEAVKALKLNKITGVYVANVSNEGGAKAAGIQPGDFITAINNVAVNSVSELNVQVSKFKPGDNIQVSFLRSGINRTANVELKNMNGSTEIIKDKSATPLMGAVLRNMRDDEKVKWNTQSGVVVSKVGTGILAKANVHDGFVITGVNGNEVQSSEELNEKIATQNNLQIEGFYPGKNGMYYYNLPTE